MAIIITGTGRAAPARRVTNEELAARLDTSDEWIRSHTGIGARHIASEGEATSDFAIAAAKNALEMAKCGAENLDFVIGATVTNDFIGFPALSCIVQGAIGASHAGCFDISSACTGFIAALATAASILESPFVGGGRKKALVVGAETLSRFVDWDDRASCVLFGDGAGAAVVEIDENAKGSRRGIIAASLGADGAHGEALCIRRGGARNPIKKGEMATEAPAMFMDGRAVYNFAVKALTDTIERLFAASGLGADDIALFVPHQANARIVQAAAKRLGLDMAKFYLNIEEYANTSAASIPIALDELNRAGRLHRGDILLLVGFGAGLTYGGIVLEW